MTNAIQLLTKTAIEMSELDALIAAEVADEEGQAYDFKPLKVKIAGGGINQFVTPGGDTLKEISAIMVISQKARAYWPASDDSEQSPPLCQSPDAVNGLFNADVSDTQFAAATHTKTAHPGVVAMSENKPAMPTYDCVSCPLNQWGSADKGRGKACKEMRKIVLLVEGWSTPVILTLPPTSITPFDTFASGQRTEGGQYFLVRVKLGLEKKGQGNTAYSVLTITSPKKLTDEEKYAVVEIRNAAKAYVKESIIEAGDYVNGSTTGDSADEVAPF